MEKLDQLRRSSVIEFEHLKKDEHPNPPLRALPEHSVLDEKSLEGPASLDGASGHGSSQTQKDNDAADVVIPGAFPGAPGIAHKDFASEVGTTDSTGKSSIQDQGPSNDPAPRIRSSVSDRFFPPGGLASSSGEGHPGSQHFSEQDFSTGSSTLGQNFSSSVVQHPADQHADSSQHHSLSAGHQIQAGNTTFTLPVFGDAPSVETNAAGDEVLSPTQFKG